MGVVEALFNYFIYGLHPGSMTYQLIAGDYDEAFARAHPHLKPDPTLQDPGADVVRNLFNLVQETMPACCLGAENYKKWTRHSGLSGLPPRHPELLDDLMILQLSDEESAPITKSWIFQMHDFFGTHETSYASDAQAVIDKFWGDYAA